MRRFLIAALLLLALPCHGQTITVTDAWVAEGPPAVPINAGYMQIANNGDATVTLIAVESPIHPRIEMHESRIEGGVTSMKQVDRIDIAPGTHILFAPGGLHLMIYNTGTPPRTGDVIPLRLHFADGTIIDVNADTRKMTDDSHHNHAREPAAPDSLFVAVQRLLPQHFLSSLMYRLTRAEWPPLKNLLIRNFIRLYNVDMSIAVQPDPERYRHFNEFFTRALKPDARPVDPAIDGIVSPVDGAISQFGRIEDGRLLQAKGRHFTATELLGGDAALGERFRHGDFITIYLSPRDYHRIHMPVGGTLESMSYVPGDLFSVNPATTESVENLFARNERVVQIFDAEPGKVALVMVGAIFVGSMETVWAGEITPAETRQPYTTAYSDQHISIDKGAEMGRFNMGSTVILLFEQGRLQWEDSVRPDQPLRLGQKIATLKQDS